MQGGEQYRNVIVICIITEIIIFIMSISTIIIQNTTISLNYVMFSKLYWEKLGDFICNLLKNLKLNKSVGKKSAE